MIVCEKCKGRGWVGLGVNCNRCDGTGKLRQGDKMKDNRVELFQGTRREASLAGATLSRSIEALEQELLATQAANASLEVRIAELQNRNAELENQRNDVQRAFTDFKTSVRETARRNDEMRLAFAEIKRITEKV